MDCCVEMYLLARDVEKEYGDRNVAKGTTTLPVLLYQDSKSNTEGKMRFQQVCIWFYNDIQGMFLIIPCTNVCFHRLKKSQLDAQLIVSIFRQPLHVSGVSRSIIRKYNRMYTTIGTYYSFQMAVCCPGWIGFQYRG